MIKKIIFLMFFIILSSACVVMKSTHDAALLKIQDLTTEKEGLSNSIKQLGEKLEKKTKELLSLSGNFKILEEDIEAKSTELAKLKKDLEEIKGSRNKDFEDLKTKVKEIQASTEALIGKINELQK